MVEALSILQKNFQVLMPKALLCTWSWDNCYQGTLSIIILCLSMSKINCSVSTSSSLNQPGYLGFFLAPLGSFLWKSHPQTLFNHSPWANNLCKKLIQWKHSQGMLYFIYVSCSIILHITYIMLILQYRDHTNNTPEDESVKNRYNALIVP